LKTSLRYQLEKLAPAVIEARRADLCASYQKAVFESLVRKSRLALERPSTRSGQAMTYRSFGLSGGVANNRVLQNELEKVAREYSVSFHRALPQHTGDNAGMIAFAAWIEREAGGVKDAGFALEIEPSLPLAQG
jgi:N6-L-threonylcarbamoyladenine synthase